MLSFMRNCWAVFQSGYSLLLSHQQWEFLLFHILANIWCCQFWISAILIGVLQHLVVLTCTSLMTYDGEHIFICLLAIYICISVELSVQIFCPFLIGLLFSYCWVLRGFFIYYIFDTSPVSNVCLAKCFFFFHVCGFSLYSLTCVFCREVFNFNEVQLFFFCFMAPAFGIISKRLLPTPRSPRCVWLSKYLSPFCLMGEG